MEPVSFANVSLYNLKDSSLAAAGISDTTGHFYFSRIREGNYRLRVNIIGYEEYKKEVTLQYELTNSGSTISFGATFLFVLPIGILMGIYFYSKSRKKEALNQ